MQKAGGP